jgi:choline kinase/phosphatidylglycerophosphate synthase
VLEHPDAIARTGPSEVPDRVPRFPRVGVVLAAGRSERLGDATGGGSKALVRVGGLALVERAIRSLIVAGVQRVVVVVGYRAGPVGAVVDRLAPGRVRAVFADEWERGNGASLAAAEPLLADEQLFVLVAADHLFGEGALERLCRAGEGAVLVDATPAPDIWSEGTKVRVERGRAVAFSKELEDSSIDCGAFMLPFTVFEAQRRAAARGDLSLAGAVTELAREAPLAVVPLPDACWWQDVDTPEDLKRARHLLRRSLIKKGDGPVSRFLNRPLSTRLSMALAPLRLSPDLISFLAFLLAIAGAVMLAAGRGVAGAILVHLASIADGLDGEAARLQVRASAAGALLDGVLDRLADAAVVAGLSIWALADGGVGPTAVVVLAVVATAGSMLSMATKDRITALALPAAPERTIGYLLGGRDGRLFIIAVAALFGVPVAALLAVSMTASVSLVARVVIARVLAASLSLPSRASDD